MEPTLLSRWESFYVIVGSAAAGLTGLQFEDFFVVAAAALVLLFSGIHNAWDTVTYLATERPDLIRKTAAPPPES